MPSPTRICLIGWMLAFAVARPNQGICGPAEKVPAEDAATLGYQGLRALEARDFEAARVLFERAESLAHSPVFVMNLGRALEGIGKFSAARAQYERCSGEPTTSSSPGPFVSAQAKCGSLLAHLILIFPRLVLFGSRETGETRKLRVLVKETQEVVHQLDRAKLSRHEILLDPGTYSLEIEGDGHYRTLAIPRLNSGSVVHLRLPAPEPTDHSISGSPASTTRPPEEVEATRAPQSATWTAWGLGALGLLSAAGLGIAAATIASEIDSRCAGTLCDPRDRAKAEEAQRLARLADIGLVLGLVGATTGFGIWLWPDTPTSPAGAKFSFQGEF